ncbi:MAG: hypothetical protein AAGF54_08285 [Pseudomonadota bacterium]
MEFPVSELKPIHARVFEGPLKEPSIEVYFESFVVEDVFEGEVLTEQFDNPLRADYIQFPSSDVLELQGKTFNFPANPKKGYIDASIYFMGCHSPVDITRIVFGTLSNDQLLMGITSRWLFTLEGVASNDFDFDFTVPVRI